MAGRDERRGRDLDDWFDEPERPIARRPRPAVPRAQTDVSPAGEDDWLGGGDARPARRTRLGSSGALSDPRLAIGVVVALLVLLGLGLALGGVFGSSTPRRVATTIVPAHAGTTSAPATATQPQSSPAAAPSGPLSPGDQGSEVKVLQRALASLGYSSGAVDGTYGTSTQRAVARFQSFSNLTPDGILGPQTLLALGTALKGP